MSEALSGLVQQTFQKTLESNSYQQQQTQSTQNKPKFESYLQKEQQQTQQTTSGADMERKLQDMQTQLAEKIRQNNAQKPNPNEVSKELLDSKSRLSLLKEAYGKMGETGNVTSGFEGRLTSMETEYKEVEAIMKSDKNLTQGELLALQARLYQVSQHIEVMSKVVDQMSGGIKTILNTNL